MVAEERSKQRLQQRSSSAPEHWTKTPIAPQPSSNHETNEDHELSEVTNTTRTRKASPDQEDPDSDHFRPIHRTLIEVKKDRKVSVTDAVNPDDQQPWNQHLSANQPTESRPEQQRQLYSQQFHESDQATE
jgi:hypothetical protein